MNNENELNPETGKIRKGRPPKKSYDEEAQRKRLLAYVDYIYDNTKCIRATAEELQMSTVKVKKLLVTSGKLQYAETEQIQRLMAYGMKMAEIQAQLGLKKSAINSYLPYSKVPYKEEEVSANADRCELYRNRKQAVAAIYDIESLWKCIELFAGYPFYTVSGLKFTYSVKGGEIFIDRKKQSITRSTVEKAYEKVCTDSHPNVDYEIEGLGEIEVDGLIKPMYKRPKELGDLFGISYIYPIFYRFGLIDVPEKTKEKMRDGNKK